jgi:hypothetical protein
MDPLVISAISAATALVASILGPIVTLKVSRRQFSANVLSANRQKWIETLRDRVAELISLLEAALVFKSAWKNKRDKGQGGSPEQSPPWQRHPEAGVAAGQTRNLRLPWLLK